MNQNHWPLSFGPGGHLRRNTHKARRGERHTAVAIGYVRTSDNRLEKDPDRRIQDAIELVFTRFAHLQSLRQVLLWLRQENMALPSVRYGSEGRVVIWQLPGYSAVHKLLTNPVYAGAYVFGRAASWVRIEASRERIARRVRQSPAD